MTETIIFLFSVVVWIAKGHYDPSIVFLALCFFFWIYTIIFNFNRITPLEIGFRYFPVLAGIMMCINSDLNSVSEIMRPYYWCFRFVPLALALVAFRVKRKNVILVCYLLLFLSVVFLSPTPFIDVFKSNTVAARFLMAGLNPYSERYTDIYKGEFTYLAGFLYWPSALYLQTLSQFLFHDIRVVLIFSWWSAVFFMSKKYRLTWCSIPFLAFGFEQAWLDPVLSLCAAVSLWSIYKRNYFILALGIAISASIKQYGFLVGFFVMAWLYLEGQKREFWKVGLLALTMFVLLLGPFLIWNFHDFIAMTVTSHAMAAPRADALNLTAFWMKWTGAGFSTGVQIFMTLLGFALGLFHLYKNRVQRGLKIIPEAWAIAFGFSILFGKFAFCNYYWLLISFWLLSLAWSNENVDEYKLQA